MVADDYWDEDCVLITLNDSDNNDGDNLIIMIIYEFQSRKGPELVADAGMKCVVMEQMEQWTEVTDHHDHNEHHDHLNHHDHNNHHNHHDQHDQHDFATVHQTS